MSEGLTGAELGCLLEHLGFVEVEQFNDWKRYRPGCGGIQSLVMDMSRERYFFDDVCNDLIRVGVPRDDVVAAYAFMQNVD